jgi:hypothetical protein
MISPRRAPLRMIRKDGLALSLRHSVGVVEQRQGRNRRLGNCLVRRCSDERPQGFKPVKVEVVQIHRPDSQSWRCKTRTLSPQLWKPPNPIYSRTTSKPYDEPSAIHNLASLWAIYPNNILSASLFSAISRSTIGHDASDRKVFLSLRIFSKIRSKQSYQSDQTGFLYICKL